MDRRQFLATTALAAGLAGCPTGSVPIGGPATTAPSPDVTLRSALRYVVDNDAVGVAAPEAAQFAFVRPPPGAVGEPPGDFALELGDREFAPRSSIPGFQLLTPGVGQVYVDAKRSGWLAFDVPTVEAASSALVADGTRYPLPADSLPRFAAAPDLAPESVATPETVAPEGNYEVRVTVSNDGGREGTFLAGFQRGGLFRTVEVAVPAGGTEAVTRRLEVLADAGQEEAVRFVWAGGYETHGMPVEGGG